MARESPVKPVPIVAQQSSASCGSAALFATLLYWIGEDAKPQHEADLWKTLRLDKDSGVEPEAIVRCAREHGLAAALVKDQEVDDLLGAIDAGATPILLMQAWKKGEVDYLNEWDSGHYAVAIGYDADGVTLMDPSVRTRYATVSFDELPARWHSPDVKGRHEYGVMVLVRGEYSALETFPDASAPQE